MPGFFMALPRMAFPVEEGKLLYSFWYLQGFPQAVNIL
jgi:hypothetical protein